MAETRKRSATEEQGVDEDRGAHPHQHQQAEQYTREEDLPARFRLDEDHARETDRLAVGEAAALLIKADRKQRPDHHESREGREQDVVPPECEQSDDDRDRDEKYQQPVGEAHQRVHQEVAPSRGEPCEGGGWCKVATPSLFTWRRRNYGRDHRHDRPRVIAAGFPALPNTRTSLR